MSVKIPDYLGKTGRKWIKNQLSIVEIKPELEEILLLAAHNLERIEAARKAVDKEGMYVEDRFGQLKPHPMVRAELEYKAQFEKLCKILYGEAVPKKSGKDELEDSGFGGV